MESARGTPAAYHETLVILTKLAYWWTRGEEARRRGVFLKTSRLPMHLLSPEGYFAVYFARSQPAYS